MGKRYHCDYCNKTLVAVPSLIRTHNKGIGHQSRVQEHYQNYKDPETILAEESKKKLCNRFPLGKCAFGAVCRFSHYTKEQINILCEIVAAKKNSHISTPPPSFYDLYQKLQNDKAKNEPDDNITTLYDSNGVTHVLPWNYNSILDNYGISLPPSLKRMKLEDFEDADFAEWG